MSKSAWWAIFVVLTSLLLCPLSIFIADPFNYFNWTNFPRKYEIAYSQDQVLTKLSKLRNDPRSNLVMGSSLMDLVGESEHFKTEMSGTHINLAYGSTYVMDMVRIFWYATTFIKLQNVYMNINFNQFSTGFSGDRASRPIALLTGGARSYMTDTIVVQASRMVLRSLIPLIGGVSVSRPPMTRERLWNMQLNETTKTWYEHYELSDEYALELRKIKNYCNEHGINLYFVVMPNHIKFQNAVNTYNLKSKYQEYLQTLSSISTVFDFNYPNSITIPEENFLDSLHYEYTREDISEILIQDIFGHGKKKIARVY